MPLEYTDWNDYSGSAHWRVLSNDFRRQRSICFLQLSVSESPHVGFVEGFFVSNALREVCRSREASFEEDLDRNRVTKLA